MLEKCPNAFVLKRAVGESFKSLALMNSLLDPERLDVLVLISSFAPPISLLIMVFASVCLELNAAAAIQSCSCRD